MATEADRRVQALLKGLGDISTEQLEELLTGAETELSTREAVEAGGLIHITQLEEEIETATKTWGKVAGISTGLPALDRKIGGLKPGELILIGGETSNGKSALAQNIAVNVAKETGVLYITLEMRASEVGQRMHHINGGKIDDLNLMFQEEYQLDYRHVESLFKNGIDNGVGLVVLDYLQYLGRGMTLDEVAKMSKIMKRMALTYEIPFIVIVSLRKGDGGKNKRKWVDIEMDDLMGTAAIGYDTDVAMIASRRDLDNEYDNEHFFVKVLKTRNMPLDYDDRYITFDWDKTRISEGVWSYSKPQAATVDAKHNMWELEEKDGTVTLFPPQLAPKVSEFWSKNTPIRTSKSTIAPYQIKSFRPSKVPYEQQH